MVRFMMYLLQVATILVMSVSMVSAFTVSSFSALGSSGQSQRAKPAALFAGPLETVAEVAPFATHILAWVAAYALYNSACAGDALLAEMDSVEKSLNNLERGFTTLANDMTMTSNKFKACRADMAEMRDGMKTYTNAMAAMRAEIAMPQKDADNNEVPAALATGIERFH
jgi:peptidoglycan hydrolase CwlO-like protein